MTTIKVRRVVPPVNLQSLFNVRRTKKRVFIGEGIRELETRDET